MTTVKRTTASTGRSAIFRGKVDGRRIQGVIRTTPGAIAFEQARARLAKLAGLEVERVSDADTIEYLAIGETATKKHIKEQSQQK